MRTITSGIGPWGYRAPTIIRNYGRSRYTPPAGCLANHIRSCHPATGKIDPVCNACKELAAKIEAVSVTESVA
jgi:hypothetical protein